MESMKLKLIAMGIVSLKMKDVSSVEEFHGDFVLNTGSPHYVKMVSDVMSRCVQEGYMKSAIAMSL